MGEDDRTTTEGHQSSEDRPPNWGEKDYLLEISTEVHNEGFGLIGTVGEIKASS